MPRLGRLPTLLGLSVLVSTVAVALPWDTDMADSRAVKAYERPMAPLPEGVVSQPNLLTPNAYTSSYDRMSPEGQALTAPFEATPEVLATGQRMYDVYCTPCHGDGENLGPVAEPGRFPAVIPLTGNGGVLKSRSDGYVYLTIRNGGAIMPYYGWAMSDDEMWSLVHYMRTLPGAAYNAPAPAQPEEAR